MAVYYVYSGAGGSNNGTSWANAYLLLATAMTGKAAGDTFYVAHDHAESSAGNVTLTTAASTLANPVKVVCADRGGSVPPVSADRRATAQVTTTGATFITISSSAHYDGIIFNCGTGAANTTITILASGNHVARFDNCSLRILTTTPGANAGIVIGATTGANYAEFNNTTVSFGAAGYVILVYGRLRWTSTPSALLGTMPTTLFPSNGRGASIECIGVDFSAAGAGTTLVPLNGGQGGSFTFVDCKLHASVVKSVAQFNFGAVDIDFVRSAATATYSVHRQRMSGVLTEESTIVRTGGASDGTTTISWKIVTTTNCNYSIPFICPDIAIWNDATGSAVTATVEGIWGGGAVPNDDDVWVEAQYLGDASSPQASFVNDGKANVMATAAGQASSSSTWGGSTTKFKLNVSFTAQQKGWVYARVKCAKASSTFYIDPLVTLA